MVILGLVADAHQQTLGWPFQQIVQVMSDASRRLICVSCFDIQLLQASDIMHEPFGRQNWPYLISILMHPSAYKGASGLLAVLVLNLWLNGTPDLFFSASILEHHHLRSLNSHKELSLRT